MVVVYLRKKVVQFRRVLGFQGMNHSRFQELAEGLGLLHRRQQLQPAPEIGRAHV